MTSLHLHHPKESPQAVAPASEQMSSPINNERIEQMNSNTPKSIMAVIIKPWKYVYKTVQIEEPALY